jgi:uncharacterized protein GlcG (DUF336 family)
LAPALVLTASIGLLAETRETTTPVSTDLATAKKAVAAAAEAAKRQAGGAIAVVDAGVRPVYWESLDNTFPAGPTVAPST